MSTPSWSLRSLSAALQAGEILSTDIVAECVARIEQLDPQLGAFVTVFADRAMDAARHRDRERADGIVHGPLHGIPLGIKDLIATDEGVTTAQSQALEPEWGDIGDGEAVGRLRAAGAIVLGKLSTLEFAGGALAADNPFPRPRNPWDLDRWAGGSSSGSGVAVAAQLVPAALGTDTGGSIRCPAALTGVTGLKPTYGLISMTGICPAGWSFDTVGPMARSVWDCAALFEVMAGIPVLEGLRDDIDGLRIGVDRSLISGCEDADAMLEARFEAALDVLRGRGARLVDITVPFLQELGDVTQLECLAEAYAWHRTRLRDRWDDYGPSIRRSLLTGLLLSSGDKVQLDRVRTVAGRSVRAAFADLDAVVMVSAHAGAPLESEVGRNGGRFTSFWAPWNAVGYPALSVPMGVGASGMPLGLQIIARPSRDAMTLRVGHAFQSDTPWHLETPPALSARGRASGGGDAA
ncbi:MAG: amidase [Nocardioides sp.]|uniref:amidase n=1 Tax=Nocardioides sp. TaxID=35761 RepID=UPI0039E25B6E